MKVAAFLKEDTHITESRIDSEGGGCFFMQTVTVAILEWNTQYTKTESCTVAIFRFEEDRMQMKYLGQDIHYT